MTNEDFQILCNHTNEYKTVEQKNRDISGGIITFEEIDKFSEIDSNEKIRVSGLRQDTFEYFIQTQAYRFNVIMFWKNKLVKDWSLLSTLKSAVFIGYFHNQRIDRMWDMTENIALEGLYISDFTRLHTLKGIEKAPKLERLSFGDAIWDKSVLEDLNPLENSRLKEFSFSGKSIKTEDISIYTKMPELEVLDFRSNLYTTEQLAWLVAKLPNVNGFSLRPYIEFDRNSSDMSKDVLICGKRKPFLSSIEDTQKIKAYVDKFEKLVAQYRNV
jgi:hypothetical protein